MNRTTVARVIISLVSIVTLVGSWVADYNETHIFNPNWPPHAKFHGGQTLFFSMVAGLLALFYTWRRSGQHSQNFATAAIFASVYWVTQLLAGLMPGSALTDPEFVARTPRPFGLGGPQPLIATALLLLVVIACAVRPQAQPAKQS